MDAETLRHLSAAVAIGLGAIGPGIGEGNVASRALEAIGRNPEAASKITPVTFITMAIIESVAIYALVVALIILFS
ncbi:MAG: ATP synthase F0 subunit C [Patescibacteria group bacterium]|nr:ATP synthase F0 subunit C [Patescibacteria group bacterium]